MRAIDISSLRNGFKGTQFRELVAHHLFRQSQRERVRALQGTIAMLPEKCRSIPEGFIDRWNARIHDPAFWERDSADVFDEIIADARNALRPFGHDKDDEAAFNLFNIVVINYAYNAELHPEMRTMLGVVARSFPFASAICLLYPIAATILMSRTPATGTEITGYGIANLAYLLFAAGIAAGSFRVFGLRSRKMVFGAAVLAFVVGVFLTNIA